MTGFPESFRIEFDGQVYSPLGVRTVTKEDGFQHRVIDWQTDCPDCGEPFVATSGMKVKIPRRFCDACKAPGKRVSNVRRQQRKLAEAVP